MINKIRERLCSLTDSSQTVNIDGFVYFKDVQWLLIEINELKAEIDRLKALNEWQPIETAPKDGTEFLMYDPNFNHYSVRYIDNGRNSLYPGGMSIGWGCSFMPLPQPPTTVQPEREGE